MRDKLLAIADRLEERADKFREPYKDDHVAFMTSPSFPIYTVLREIATQIKAELNP